MVAPSFPFPKVRWPALQSVGLRTVATWAALEHERWPLWLPVGLATGIAVYFALPVEPSFELGIWLGIAGLLLGVTAALSPETWLRVILAALASLLIGFGAAKLKTELVSAPFSRIA